MIIIIRIMTTKNMMVVITNMKMITISKIIVIIII